MEMERSLKKRWSSDRPRIQVKGRSQGLTLLLRLWSAHKKGYITTALRKTQQATEKVRWNYLHLTNGQLTPVIELGRLKEVKEKVDSIGGPDVLIILDP